MSRGRYRYRPGLTLLEAVLSILIVSIIAAVLTPVIAAATDSFAIATASRRHTDQVTFATDRIVRMIREIPLKDGDPTLLGISTLTADSLVLDDGKGIRLADGELILTDASGRSGLLCDGVTGFALEFFGPDGATPTGGLSPDAYVAEIRLEAHGLDIRTRVFPRVNLMGEM